MVIISTLDQQIFVDNIDLKSDEIIRQWTDSKDPDLKQPEYSYVSIKHVRGGSFCSTWPFMAIEGLSKRFLQVINLNKPDVIHRI